jgi:hypothetical protein
MSLFNKKEPERSIEIVTKYVEKLASHDKLKELGEISEQMRKETIRCWLCNHDFTLLYAIPRSVNDWNNFIVCPHCHKSLASLTFIRS